MGHAGAERLTLRLDKTADGARIRLNLAESHVSEQSTAWLATLMAKLTVVAITGISAAVHAGTKSKTVLAVTGALSLLSALLAVWFGLLLAG